MMKKQEGFTLVELMMAMIIFLFAIMATSQVFTSLVRQFKQQTKITETNIEGVVGLEMFRRDIEKAGFGLPWDMNGATYSEAVNDAITAHNDTLFNDEAAEDPPRAFVSGNGSGALCAGGVCSDVLVVKATNVSLDPAAERWTHIVNRGGTNIRIPVWKDTADNVIFDKSLRPNPLDNTLTDRVIVVRPKLGDRRNVLVVDVGAFFTDFNPGNTDPPDFAAGYSPDADSFDAYMIYGIRTDADPRMPFNRADYYVRIPVTMPARCAQGTGVLYKATVNHPDGLLTEYPLLDCVADLQVAYRLDIDGDGFAETAADDISGMNAEEIRAQLREVRVFVLTHEGQKESTYTFSSFTCGADCLTVGDATVGSRDLNISGITDHLNYRWKLYTMIIKPHNMRL